MPQMFYDIIEHVLVPGYIRSNCRADEMIRSTTIIVLSGKCSILGTFLMTWEHINGDKLWSALTTDRRLWIGQKDKTNLVQTCWSTYEIPAWAVKLPLSIWQMEWSHYCIVDCEAKHIGLGHMADNFYRS